MATISRRIQDLETKTTRAAGTVLTVIRKILRPNTPEGGTWVAKFDAQHSPSKLAGKDFFERTGRVGRDVPRPHQGYGRHAPQEGPACAFLHQQP